MSRRHCQVPAQLALSIGVMLLFGCRVTVEKPDQPAWCFDFSELEAMFESVGQDTNGMSIVGGRRSDDRWPLRRAMVEARLRPGPTSPSTLGPLASAEVICRELDVLVHDRCRVTSRTDGPWTCSRYAIQEDTQGWLDVAVLPSDRHDAWFIATVTEVRR